MAVERSGRTERPRTQRPGRVKAEPDIVTECEPESRPGALKVPGRRLTGLWLLDPEIGHVVEGHESKRPLDMFEGQLRQGRRGHFDARVHRIVTDRLVFTVAAHRFHATGKVLFGRYQRFASPL